MILAAGLSPAWQQILVFDTLQSGEVNRAREVHWCASGKVLNVGLALHHLGAEATTLSVVGGLAGAEIQREFAAANIAAHWGESTSPTRVCTTVIERDAGRITELVENSRPISDADLEQFAAAFQETASQARMVVVTGSIPQGTPVEIYRDLLVHANGRVVLDIRGPELLACLEHNPLVVKPNRHELAQTLGRKLDDDEQLIRAMRELNERGADWVVVSDGERAVYARSSLETFRLNPPRAEVVNPIGCGDCLAAGIAWALDNGSDVLEAVRYGMAAAADNLGQLLPARLNADRVRALAQTIDVQDAPDV